MAMKTDDELMDLLKIFNEKNGFSLSDHHDPKRLVRLCVGSGNNFSEISNFIKPFVIDFDEYDKADFDKHLLESERVLNYFKESIHSISDWNEAIFEEIINSAIKDLDLPMPKIGLPLRVALVGRAKSPPLSSTIYLIEKNKTIERLDKALKVISEH
jgi:Glutamyl- and glutaminyl-tRNA synthetases